MSDAIPRIIATLGTTTDDSALLSRMVDAGMGMGRINTAYATPEQIGQRIDRFVQATTLPVMLDLKGRQIRVDCTTTRTDPQTGETIERPCRYPVHTGDLVCVGFGAASGMPVRFNLNFEDDLEEGDIVTFANGTIRARTVDPESVGIEPTPRAVLLEILDAGAGQFSPQMGANVPGRALSLPALSARDREMIALGHARSVACYALSFAQRGRDLTLLHEVLLEHGDAAATIVAKIEDPVGVTYLEEILEAMRATGRPLAVMIARGDLFVEFPPEQLPEIQRDLVARCRARSVPCIVATGLLLSMTEAAVPSRAEVSDVAAAIAMGADALMLSDETSNSRHPLEAVALLSAMWRRYGSQR